LHFGAAERFAPDRIGKQGNVFILVCHIVRCTNERLRYKAKYRRIVRIATMKISKTI